MRKTQKTKPPISEDGQRMKSLHRRLRKKPEKWKSHNRVILSKPSEFQGRNISNFPVKTRIPGPH